MGTLEGRAAVVTGAGTGIGRSSAIALAAEGARVALVGRRRELLDAVAGEIDGADKILVAPADLTDEMQVAALAETVLRRWGRMDILVNNAGTNIEHRHLAEVTPGDWQSVIAANLHGPFLLTRALLPAMRAAGSGTIINISSVAGLRTSLLSGPAYSASKAALISFTESINLAERMNGIRACVICPGEVETPILEHRPVPPSPAARATMLQPEDVAAAALFVATLPPRAAVDLIEIRPTILRDMTAERQAATTLR